jgi:hypothetical protein
MSKEMKHKSFFVKKYVPGNIFTISMTIAHFERIQESQPNRK